MADVKAVMSVLKPLIVTVDYTWFDDSWGRVEVRCLEEFLRIALTAWRERKQPVLKDPSRGFLILPFNNVVYMCPEVGEE